MYVCVVLCCVVLCCVVLCCVYVCWLLEHLHFSAEMNKVYLILTLRWTCQRFGAKISIEGPITGFS